MCDILNKSALKKLIHENGKRCSDDFVTVLQAHVVRKIREACAVHNGGAKTLDASVAAYVGLTPK